MEEETGNLPMFFAGKDDVVLVKDIPPQKFLKSFEQLNFKPPIFISYDNFSQDSDFINSPKNRLLPWGWSPAAHWLLEPLKTSCSQDFKNSPVYQWQPEHREIYSKKFALDILKKLAPLLPDGIILPKHLIPEIYTSRQEIEKMIGKWDKIMVKAPWSSSGRGLQRIRKTPITEEKVWEKLLGIVKEQGYGIAEPLHRKVADMAFEFKAENGKISFIGISRFSTDNKGQYRGNYLNGWPDDFDSGIIKFADSLPEIVIEPLISVLEQSKLAKYYEGDFGVDTLIFRDDENNLRVNPCLEINVRQNMGLLSLKLEKLISPDKKGMFRTYYNPKQTFYQFKAKMDEKFPPVFKNSKLNSGFFALTPAYKNTSFGAYIIIN